MRRGNDAGLHYCINIKKHRPETHHSPNGECVRDPCRWRIHELNQDVEAMVASGMKEYTPVFDQAVLEAVREEDRKRKLEDDPRIEYAILRKFLHFKEVLAGRPEVRVE